MSVFFIAGTDTDVGKTLVSSALLQRAYQRGLSTLGLKPVAAGCTMINGQLKNEDALKLLGHSSTQVDYNIVNPVALEPAIAPHIAAELIGQSLSMELLTQHCLKHMDRADFTIIEGAGGWMVPLNDQETLADVAVSIAAPVILVVGLRLGCINHSLLTVQSILQSGLSLAAWVANVVDPSMAEVQANYQSLCDRIPAPCIGLIPHMTPVSIKQASACLDIGKLLPP